MIYAQVGTISHGTLRSVDLLDSFSWELIHHLNRNVGEPGFQLHPGEIQHMYNLASQAKDMVEKMQDEDLQAEYDDQEIEETISELMDELDIFAPPYCTFGAHPGDGSDFGFWPLWDMIDELPHGEPGEKAEDDYKYVNDHGNVTVYSADGKVLLELV